jgi:hypothetical protein
MSTNPVKTGVEDNSVSSAAAKLLEPQNSETIKQPEPEQTSPEEETLKAEVLETEEVEASTEESEVGDQEEEGEPEEKDEEPHHTIKYDGTEYEVTLGELKKGYQLQKDYTQKTQSLSERRTEVDALAANLETERQKYIDINSQILSQHQSALKAFDNVDWKTLRSEDPMGYIDKVAEKQEVERVHAEESMALETALSQQQLATHEQLKTHLEAEAAALQEVLPEYGDPEKGPEFRSSISAYAAQSGYSNHEISNVVNARDLVILNKARLWDDMQGTKAGIREKKTGEKASIRIKSSSPKGSKSKARETIDAQKLQARSSGKKEDAASAILNLMKG